MFRRKPTYVAWTTLGGYLFIAATTPINGQGIGSIKEIEKSWKERQDRIRAVRVDWTEQHTLPKGHLSTILGRLPDGDKRGEQMGIPAGSTVPPEDVTFDITRTFAFEGDKARLDQDDKQWSAKENAYVSEPQVTVYDGKENKRYVRQGTSYAPWPYGSRQMRHPFRSWLLLGPLVMTFCPMHNEMRLFDIHTFALTGRQRLLGGRSCLELQRRSGDSGQLLFIDAAHDFVISRYVLTNKERITYKIDITYEKDRSGEWVPMGWETISYRLDGSLDRSTKARVTAVQINPPIDTGLFDLHFPVGTLVRDERDRENVQRYIVRPDDRKRIIPLSEYEKTYDELVNSEPEGFTGKGRNILSSLFFWAAVLAFISGSWLLWRRGFWRKRAERPRA